MIDKLSDRLRKIAVYVPDNAYVADIGTDHGYLPIFLVSQNKAKKVIACDIREKPLDNARRNIEKSGVSNIELRLSDGLCNINSDEADTVIIAGMGGDVIAGILNRSNWIKNDRYFLILQPMTSAEQLRKYLFDNGFETETESAVEDADKIYTVITARYSGRALSYSSDMLFTGKLDVKNQTDKKYILKQLNRLKNCIKDIENIPSQAEKFKLYSSAVQGISRILEEKNGI